MKPVRTMKKLLCLLLTFCMALSCVTIASAADEIADDNPPVGAPAKMVVPVDNVTVTCFRIYETDDPYTVDSAVVELQFADVTDASGEVISPFEDQQAHIDRSMVIPVTYQFCGYPIVAGYAVPRVGPMDTVFTVDFYSEDGTPGIKMAHCGIINDIEVEGQTFSIDQNVPILFGLKMDLPEGFFSNDAYENGAFSGEVIAEDLPMYSEYFIPDDAINISLRILKSLADFADAHPKTANFILNALSKALTRAARYLKLDDAHQEETVAKLSEKIRKLGIALKEYDPKKPGTVFKLLWTVLPFVIPAAVVFIIGDVILLRVIVLTDHLMRSVYGVSLKDFVMNAVKSTQS